MPSKRLEQLDGAGRKRMMISLEDALVLATKKGRSEVWLALQAAIVADTGVAQEVVAPMAILPPIENTAMVTGFRPFHHATFGDIRVRDQNGEPWYIAKDVCDALDIVNVSHAMNGLDPDEYATINVSNGNTIAESDSIPIDRRGNPNVLIINDSGLSTLAFRSNKPEAKRFRKWVTREVLPAIRKTGAYMTNKFIENALSAPDGTIRLLQEVRVARSA